jgi:DNA replication and repair protein RecF
MKVIRLVNFRNYPDSTAFFSPGLNVVAGDNAHGKTNLLEALAFAATGSTPRTPNDSEMVRWGQDFTRVELRVEMDGEERAAAVGYAPKQKKRLTVDGVQKRSLAEYAAGASGVRAVTFFPDDLRIVKGAPAERREFLDGLLSTLKPSYAATISEYLRAVSQRNQLLKRIREGFSSQITLSTWDRKVVDLGKRVLEERTNSLGALGAYLESSVRALYGSVSADLEYFSSAPLEGYSEALTEAHSGDIERGYTSVGPHRDDMRLYMDGADLTTYGSQGQQRLATLALKFAARDYVRERTGEDPVLLFDDVMSELDYSRREYLGSYFLESAQAVISTTNLDYFDRGLLDKANLVRIRHGTVADALKQG